ncbi:hypothetical protein B0O80DRAFT_454065 [Mortierella sp. GBAus27b]|nr:hypothetical protein BGX31_010640 [Mortierella sp. GBA43]KAI8352228.1 hypothetical protein B0O80DRAFT_454065 [Mortierella sp. GBAus27b]
MYSFYPHTTYSVRRRPAPASAPAPAPAFHAYTSFQAPVYSPFSFSPAHQEDISLYDDTDEEELLLRAALERKQRERLARQQIRQQLELRQREQQRHEELLRRERARQLAQAQAQAQYQAEQEAIQRYKRAQLIRQQQQQQQQQRQQEAAIVEALVLQHVREAQKEEEARARAKANKEGDDDALSDLLEALFFPQAHKRTQPQEDNYPCKRRHQVCVPQKQQQQQQQQQAKVQVNAASATAKKQQEQQPPKVQNEHKKAGGLNHELYESLPAILSFVEALFGEEDSSSNQAESSKVQTKGNQASTASAGASAPRGSWSSPSSSSPDLRAADILRQRQQVQEQQTRTLQEKHSELNMIESALDSFAHDLTDVLDSVDTVTAESEVETQKESNKRIVLSAEENISKAMLQVDSVDSDGDLSVRQRRRELIKKSQDLLDRVDEYKTQRLNTGKKVVREVEPASAEIQTLAGHVDSASLLSADETEVAQVIIVEPSEDEDEPDDRVHPLSEAEGSDVNDQEQGEEDEDEVIEPYSITEALSTETRATATEEGTEQLTTEHGAHGARGKDQVEPAEKEEGEPAVEVIEGRSSTVESDHSDDSNEGHDADGTGEVSDASSTHDDYEMVPDF